jgi:hypothetical protein
LSEVNWHIVGLMLAIAAIGFVMMASAGMAISFPSPRSRFRAFYLLSY